MSLSDVADVLQHSSLGTLVASGPWVFPVVETIHVLSLATVFGSIAMLDLRLLGITSKDGAVSSLSHEVLPVTWLAFAVAAVSGILLFLSNASAYAANLQFRLKFLFMGLAAVNMLAFHFGAYRRVSQWDYQLPPPNTARIAGALSILLWLTIIVFGRWTGYTMSGG
jgi:hypothetical protein